MTLIINMEDDEWEEVAKLSGQQLERETGIQWKLDEAERKRARALVKDKA
jgi:conserved oligomeric Golgi complex subunit 4